MLDKRVEAELRRYDIAYEVLPCDPDKADTAVFCQAYGYKPETAANTILVTSKDLNPMFAACVVLATTKLDVNKKVCQLLEVKRASFANAEQTEKLTGMMIGGVVIFGLPENIPIFVDSKVMEQPEIIMGGGNRSSKLVLKSSELTKVPNLQVVESLSIHREA